jgi:hypothetical protein
MLRFTTALGATALIVGLAPTPAAGQFADRVDPDPEIPVKEGFDINRVILWSHPNFEPLRDPELVALDEARRSREVDDATTMVVFEAGGETIAIISEQMAYHHVAQGVTAGEPWMVTF